MVLSEVLTRIAINEPYRVSDVEECLSWLQQPGDRAVSCPFERGASSIPRCGDSERHQEILADSLAYSR
ncbi:hypothetical protein [Microseira sp. BLCC-F43]|uniref:hypothetical protein n=1 Tax=Microseira sp. BLCC-F43 TaxID=3153602 RepID=UPI0035B88304